ncbi:MAG: rhomboid family intramembrane serine protease [Candidatus Thermoplasmatota archaeon]
MEIMIPTEVSLVCIGIMIGAIAIARFKKVMITYSLIIANFIIFVITLIYPFVIYEIGFRPIYLTVEYFPQLYTLFTSMFIHGGFAHILGNMIVFLFMGIAFEQRIGMKNFLVIYLVTGVCGALAHSFLNLGSATVLIGASGAIFGILGAFAYSYPRDEVVMPIPLGIIMIFRRIKVMYAAILFAVLETVIVLYGTQDTTAHFAHIGGLLSGVILAAILVGKQGEKTKQYAATAVYSDPSLVPKKKKINYSTLRKLAITPELRETLSRIENETVLQVRDIWLEHFLEKTTCPICSKPLSHSSRKIWCEDDHIKMEY